MAKPRESISGKQCYCCGETYTKAFYTKDAPVCNVCMMASGGVLPEKLRFDPANAPTTPPAPETDPHADVHLTGDLEELEVGERILMRRSLLAFVQRFKTDYQAGWVHEDICRRLERFMVDVEAKKRPRLLLCMPPRHGKSTLTSNFFPAWVLGHHPEWEVIAASHTQSLALKFSGFIRDLLRDTTYTNVFPNCLLNPESQAKDVWETTRRGQYAAAGVGTGITGKGAHVLIIDDPVKDMEEADSQVIRDNVWDWYTSTAYTRLAPGGGVLGIMTLWNEDDWGGRVIEVSESGDGDKFEIVRYPAINDGYAEYLHPDERTIVHVFPKADGRWEAPANHKLLRAPNCALHEDRYDLAALLAIKKNYYARGNQRVWSALFQQRPTPEDGIFFTKDMLRFYSSPPQRRFCHVYQAWDFAISEGQESDFTVGATLMQDANDALYVLDIRRFKSGDSIEIIDTMLDYYAEYQPQLLGVEDGQIWKTLQAQWDKRCNERKLYPSYEVLKPLTDKKVRAHPLRGRMQLGKVYFPEKAEWKHDCMQELMTFPAGKHDDQVDALAWCVRLTLSKAAPTPVVEKPVRGWRDNLSRLMSGSDVGHMAA